MAGRLEVRDFGQCSSKIDTLTSVYPLRLIPQRLPPNSRGVLVFVLNYGGGLVAGDKTVLEISVVGNARLGLLTQGSTKVYKSLSSDTCAAQTLNATIQDHAAMLLLPDPVQPFADSRYEQRQIFEMDPKNSSLLFLDWFSEGRSARGEAFSLAKYKSSNEIWSLSEYEDEVKSLDKRLLLRDNIKLARDSSPSALGLQERMEGMGVFGTLIITGPVFSDTGKFFVNTYVARPRIGEKNWAVTGPPASGEQSKVTKSLDSQMTWTATSIRGFVVVRFGAPAVEDARRWLREMLTQEGTVEKEFGRQYLHCLQDR